MTRPTLTAIALVAAGMALAAPDGRAQPRLDSAGFVAAGGATAAIPAPGLGVSAGSIVVGRSGTVDFGLGAALFGGPSRGTSNEGPPGESSIPERFVVHPNYPNPFNPATRFVVELPEPADLRIELFDVMGRLRQVAIDRRFEAGRHDVVLTVGDLPSGVYVVRVDAGGRSVSRRMVLQR